MMMNYYKAHTAGGHMGQGNESELIFYIKAPTMMAALRQAKSFPAVKHSRTPRVELITKEEYDEGIKVNAYNRRDGITR